VLPLDAVVGLEVRDDTHQDSRVIDGLEMDIVSQVSCEVPRVASIQRIPQDADAEAQGAALRSVLLGTNRSAVDTQRMKRRRRDNLGLVVSAIQLVGVLAAFSLIYPPLRHLLFQLGVMAIVLALLALVVLIGVLIVRGGVKMG